MSHDSFVALWIIRKNTLRYVSASKTHICLFIHTKKLISVFFNFIRDIIKEMILMMGHNLFLWRNMANYPCYPLS